MKKVAFILLILATFVSCVRSRRTEQSRMKQAEFSADVLRNDMSAVKKISGQLVYMPVYSNVPFQIDTLKFDMSAFVAIHNTDISNPIILTRVLYFNEDGKLANDYLKNGNLRSSPLATKDYYVPYEDQGGTGAHFLIEWVADSLVNEPLMESVTMCLKPNNTVAVLSQGKIIREKK